MNKINVKAMQDVEDRDDLFCRIEQKDGLWSTHITRTKKRSYKLLFAAETLSSRSLALYLLEEYLYKTMILAWPEQAGVLREIETMPKGQKRLGQLRNVAKRMGANGQNCLDVAKIDEIRQDLRFSNTYLNLTSAIPS